VLTGEPAADEPGFPPYAGGFDMAAHQRAYHGTYGAGRSLFLHESPHTPPTVDLRGPATSYPPGDEATARRRAARTDATAYWRHIAEMHLGDDRAPAALVRAACKFVQDNVFYNPIQEPAQADAIANLELHDGRCGAAATITLAILEAAGVTARIVSLHHHVTVEAHYDDAWHLADPLFFGAAQPHRDGRVLSVEELRDDLYFVDRFPVPCMVYPPATLLSEDGYSVLGYCFGPWGSQPYWSYFLGGAFEHPPTLPTVLPALRLDADTLRLRWTESARIGGGAVTYDATVYTDRAGAEPIANWQTDQTSVDFTPPERNRMYHLHIRATDDHRDRNPDTWYPVARGNFVLVPPDQYGWYNVL
jgi:hypothetical protein